jgi:hypothetical protein
MKRKSCEDTSAAGDEFISASSVEKESSSSSMPKIWYLKQIKCIV